MSDNNHPSDNDARMKCSACGRTENLRPGSPWHGEHVICKPCFMIWYDYGETDPVKLGELSHKLEKEGKFPFRRATS